MSFIGLTEYLYKIGNDLNSFEGVLAFGILTFLIIIRLLIIRERSRKFKKFKQHKEVKPS